MHLTIHPVLVVFLAALVAIVVLLRPTDLRDSLLSLVARIRARRLRRAMERELGCPILPVIGQMNGDMPTRTLDDLRSLPESGALYVLIDSPGGLGSNGSQIVRAISERKGPVFAVVPRRAWSNGTVVATGADVIRMGPDAQLGPCCPIGHIDPTDLHSAAVMRAAEDSRTVDQVRAQWMQAEAAETIRKARIRRGANPDSAQTLSYYLTSGALGTHWNPLYLEDVRELGLVAEPLQDPRWDRLARLCLAGLQPHER